jgi:hypothetical protein
MFSYTFFILKVSIIKLYRFILYFHLFFFSFFILKYKPNTKKKKSIDSHYSGSYFHASGRTIYQNISNKFPYPSVFKFK